MQLEEKIARILIKKKKTVAVAESCTGGLLAHRLTNIPGSSSFFKIGIITYSNESKIKLLNIPPRLIQRYGAVSAEVAVAMAQGAQKILKTDFGISITGIAGPNGATLQKPIGLTFVAVIHHEKIICAKFHLKGQRQNIKRQAATRALLLLNQFLS